MNPATLVRALWPRGNGPKCPQVYVLLDGARDDAIAPAIWLSNLPYACLYAGALSKSLSLAAPYLVQLAPESQFFNKLVTEGWGLAWGIFAVAQPDVTLRVLRKHFRTLLRVQDEEGRTLAFRFYDPRVLRVYMQICEDSEALRMFGPVEALACESIKCDELIEFKPVRKRSHLSNRQNGHILTIRSAQMASFVGGLRISFEGELCKKLAGWARTPYRPEYRRLAEQFVSLAIDRAQSHQFTACSALENYVGFCYQYGLAFDEVPEIAAILKLHHLDQHHRIDLIDLQLNCIVDDCDGEQSIPHDGMQNG